MKLWKRGLRRGEVTASEASIQQTCQQLLILDGWRHLRTDPVSDRSSMNALRRMLLAIPLNGTQREMVNTAVTKATRGKGFGETGMFDDAFFRYAYAGKNVATNYGSRALVEMVWIEWKAVGGAPSPDQLKWATLEEQRGALCWLAGREFAPSIEGFRDFYFKSGLCRNVSDSGERR